MKELNDNFEKQWREQFQDAEVAPGDSVWGRIDASLSGNQVAYYKKKLFYYKMVAAASILLALTIGSFSVYNFITSPEPRFAGVSMEESTLSESLSSSERMIDSDAGISNIPGSEPELLVDSDAGIPSIPASEKGSKDAISQVIVTPNDAGMNDLLSSAQDQEVAIDMISSQNDALSGSGPFSYPEEDDHSVQVSKLGPVFGIPYERPGRKYAVAKKENPYDQPYLLTIDDYEEEGRDDPSRLWAGVNFSSGFFDPNISYGGNSQADMFSDLAPSSFGSVERIYTNNADIQDQASSIMSYKPEESSYQSNISLSYGLDFGYKFSKRFVLISGLGYQQNYGSTSVKTFVEPAASNAKYANHAIVIDKAGLESGLNTYNELNSEVQLNSTFEFVSIPVNLGYYLIDKKFKWLMTAGMSTDIFIKNTINDSQNMFDAINYRPGDDSPYNPVYFNGKFGTLIHYTFSGNYQISLEPSYRIGISNLTKDNAAFSSRPSSFLISAGFSYVF